MGAFVYIWEDLLKGMFYIGAHKGDPTDGYIASSKTFLEEYNKRPNDFRRSIVSVCDSYQIALHQETKLLMTVNARTNPKYYNMHNGDGNFVVKCHTKETKQKMSLASKGKSKSSSHVENHRQAILGKKLGPCSEVRKQRISAATKGRKRTPEQRARMSAGWAARKGQPTARRGVPYKQTGGNR